MSSILLSALTLAVFSSLQDVGPESALRKFHVAAVNGEQRALMDVTEPNVPPEAIQALQARVQAVARQGGRYEVRQISRRREWAHALVVYSVGRLEVPQIWVLEKRDGRWLVNPQKTLTLMAQPFNPGSRL